jgi:serine/threonine protein kinase
MALKSPQKARQRIGAYEVLERLAVTDMCAVYKARHPQTGELVAIKMTGPKAKQDPVLLKRFEQEFAVSRNLEHPHLVRGIQYGHEGDVPYMVLEYVDGPSLGDRIEREGRLPEAEAIRIITQVAEALHHAHRQRVVHRDVKPDNILLTADGQAKLTDLGLAKDYEADCHLTRASTGLGTPNFMAPEQFSDAKNADARCDVYSLGATLYMALTGELPFRARGSMTIWKKKLSNDLVPPRKLLPVISPWVESVICRSVNANPQMRPATCRQFIEELSGRASPPAEAAPTSWLETPSRKSHRREQRATVRYPSTKDSACQPLSGAKGVRWTAKIQDISADGIAVVLGRRFEPRTVLIMDLPATDKEPARRLFVRVVRAMSLSARRWLLGCVFAHRLGDDEVQALI